MTEKPKILTSLLRYNIIALVATATDFMIFILLTKVLGIWYVTSTIISAVSGGIVAFIFNRNWVFISKDGKITKQAIKYFFVWVTSIFLNTTGLYLVVEYTSLEKIVSKILVSASVGIGFNFLMNKFYVFK